MKWCNRIIKRKHEDGSILYGVVEYFYNDTNESEQTGYTEDSVTGWFESKKELIESIEMILKDIKENEIIDETI